MNVFSKLVLAGGLVLSTVPVSHAARMHAWIKISPFTLVVNPAPVAVARPAPQPLVEDPYMAPPPDYRQILADFHSRAERLQRVLDKQLRRHIISQEQYDAHAADLDEILHEEQRDAARHNGALTPREVNEINRRLTELQDRVHEDMAR